MFRFEKVAKITLRIEEEIKAYPKLGRGPVGMNSKRGILCHVPTKSLAGNSRLPINNPAIVLINAERGVKFLENIPKNTGKRTAAHTKSAIKNK